MIRPRSGYLGLFLLPAVERSREFPLVLLKHPTHVDTRYLSVEWRHLLEHLNRWIRVQPGVKKSLVNVTATVAGHQVPMSALGGECVCERHVTAPAVFVPAGGSAETVPATLVRITSETDSPTRAE